jgi:hypothetical protein
MSQAAQDEPIDGMDAKFAGALYRSDMFANGGHCFLPSSSDD